MLAKLSFSTKMCLPTKLYNLNSTCARAVIYSQQCKHMMSFIKKNGLDLDDVVSRLDSLASPSLACDWDNVGLLMEPSPPHRVNTVLLTNDLTLDVMEEASQHGVQMILSYHPPIFRPLKKLTQASWKERIVVKCLENRIAVYSPHTSYDVVYGGVNDWLIAPFGGQINVLQPAEGVPPGPCTMPRRLIELIQKQLSNITLTSESESTPVQSKFSDLSFPAEDLTSKNQPSTKGTSNSGDDKQVLGTVPHQGQGRITRLDKPLPLATAIDIVKKHLSLPFLRVAEATGSDKSRQIDSVAVCAGSGSSVLAGVKADLYITGEMSHHEVLDANHAGINVILCEHSNTERGFLRLLKDRLVDVFDEKIDVIVSAKDHDPLTVT